MSGFSSQKATLTYKAVGWILFPAVVIYTIINAVKHKNRQYLLQRLGIYRTYPLKVQPVWCHCASVGEIKTVLPVLKNLIASNEHLVVSTNTITGFNTLLQSNLENTTAVFLPLDYTIFAKRFLKRFCPKILLLTETELWPNILLAVSRQSKPVIIINGRISNKTLNAPGLMKKNYHRILTNAEHIFVSSQGNAERFVALGADRNKVTTANNLKFSSAELSELGDYTRPLKQNYILCASTHAGEESLIMRAWKARPLNNIQLVIAIRHPHRKDEVCRQATQLSLAYTLHSHGGPTDTDHIYIVDTIGELSPFIQHADLVFMGGSLVPDVGGHNMLEAAHFGKCIINGPHYQNFTEIVNDMLESDSIITVQNADQLLEQANMLINDEDRRKLLGFNAKKFVSEKSNTADDYTRWIINYISTHSA